MSAIQPGTHRFWDLVAETATADVLRDNPFRILDVPTDAPAREVRRAAERLKVEQRLEGDGESDGAERIEEAQRRLRDPDQRLIAELLWFWPDEAEAGSRHNRAVWVLQQFTENDPSPSNCSLAMESMGAALRHPTTEAYLVGRAEALDDKRLTTDDARQLVQTAPLLVPLLTLRLARRLHDKDSGLAAALVARVSSHSSQPTVSSSVVREAEMRVVGPIIERLRSAADRAVQSAQADGAQGFLIAEKLLDQTAEDRQLVRLLLTPGNTQSIALDDKLVDSVLTCAAVRYDEAFEAPGTDDAALRLLRKAERLSPGPAIREELDDALRTIEANKAAPRRPASVSPTGPASSATGPASASSRNLLSDPPVDPTGVLPQRFVAFWIDIGIVLGLTYLLSFPGRAALSIADDRVQRYMGMGVFFWVFVIRQGLRGVTPGKSLLGLRTVREFGDWRDELLGLAGARPGVLRSVQRYFLLFAALFLTSDLRVLAGVLILDVGSAVVTKGFKRLGDGTVGTLVVAAPFAGLPIDPPRRRAAHRIVAALVAAPFLALLIFGLRPVQGYFEASGEDQRPAGPEAHQLQLVYELRAHPVVDEGRIDDTT